jgi:hypothetical protein
MADYLKIDYLMSHLTVDGFAARPHTYGHMPKWRVWSCAWSGDEFELLSEDEFEQFQDKCRDMGIRFNVHDEDDEE